MSSKGFTLIELVVVIVILGILSVTAAPKFLNIQSDARIAALDAFVGAFKAADEVVVAKAAMAGLASSREETTIPGSEVTVFQNHMTLSVENVMKAMDTSGYNLTQMGFDPEERMVFVVYLGDEQSQSELISNGCMVIISRHLDSYGPKGHTFKKDVWFRKRYSGC